jgi:hypothetical protein
MPTQASAAILLGKPHSANNAPSMQSAQALDESLFFFINQKLSNPFLDWSMPFLNWNPIFIPALILLAVALIWKGGTRARIFLLVLVLCGSGRLINLQYHQEGSQSVASLSPHG